MKNIIAFILLTIPICSIGQYRTTFWIEEQKRATIRVDTTLGTLVAVVNGDEVKALGGFRIDSVEVRNSQIPCPDNNFGCMVAHYGKLDILMASTYWIIDKSTKPENVSGWKIINIPEKYIIKFIP